MPVPAPPDVGDRGEGQPGQQVAGLLGGEPLGDHLVRAARPERLVRGVVAEDAGSSRPAFHRPCAAPGRPPSRRAAAGRPRRRRRRPAGQLRRGLRPVAGHHDRLAVGQRQHHGRVGVHVPQPVRGRQPQLVVPDHRVALDQHVRAGAGVVPEARQGQLLGDGVAADDRLLLEDDDLEPGGGEVGRADQAVVPGADDDDVGAAAHAARTRPLGKVCSRSAPCLGDQQQLAGLHAERARPAWRRWAGRRRSSRPPGSRRAWAGWRGCANRAPAAGSRRRSRARGRRRW